MQCAFGGGGRKWKNRLVPTRISHYTVITTAALKLPAPVSLFINLCNKFIRNRCYSLFISIIHFDLNSSCWKFVLFYVISFHVFQWLIKLNQLKLIIKVVSRALNNVRNINMKENSENSLCCYSTSLRGRINCCTQRKFLFHLHRFSLTFPFTRFT